MGSRQEYPRRLAPPGNRPRRGQRCVVSGSPLPISIFVFEEVPLRIATTTFTHALAASIVVQRVDVRRHTGGSVYWATNRAHRAMRQRRRVALARNRFLPVVVTDADDRNLAGTFLPAW